jgi:hypothetical protein
MAFRQARDIRCDRRHILCATTEAGIEDIRKTTHQPSSRLDLNSQRVADKASHDFRVSLVRAHQEPSDLS